MLLDFPEHFKTIGDILGLLCSLCKFMSNLLIRNYIKVPEFVLFHQRIVNFYTCLINSIFLNQLSNESLNLNDTGTHSVFVGAQFFHLRDKHDRYWSGCLGTQISANPQDSSLDGSSHWRGQYMCDADFFDKFALVQSLKGALIRETSIL